jgi:hypothetical protein
MRRAGDSDHSPHQAALTERLTVQLLGWQSLHDPGFEATGHRGDVFVAHFLQAFRGEGGAAAAAAEAENRRGKVRNQLFDVKLHNAAAERYCTGRVPAFEFFAFTYVD